MNTPSEEFKYLLASLAEQTGVDRVEPDENGIFALQFDDRITVCLVEDQQERYISLVSDLGPPAEEVGASALGQAMLEANWLGGPGQRRFSRQPQRDRPRDHSQH